MFTDLLIYAYVEIHQVRILIFDNYQKVSRAFKMRWSCLCIIQPATYHTTCGAGVPVTLQVKSALVLSVASMLWGSWVNVGATPAKSQNEI